MLKIFMVIAALLIVFSCGSTQVIESPVGDVLPVTPEGVPIQIKVGDTFNIVLEVNPTAGYSWQIDSIGDLQLVKQNGSSQYIRDDAPRDMTGVGGKEAWTFVALSGGSTIITFRYVPEESGRERDRTIEFLIEIRE